MTDLLYMPDIEGNYIRVFDAKVTKSKKDYVVLDKSAFYQRENTYLMEPTVLYLLPILIRKKWNRTSVVFEN